jgi:hypothetical protein
MVEGIVQHPCTLTLSDTFVGGFICILLSYYFVEKLRLIMTHKRSSFRIKYYGLISQFHTKQV